MKIALGVSGGIAAYKAAEIVRQLQERGVTVQVIMTAAAQEFVRPLTFAALSGEKVITSMFGSRREQPNLDSAIEHISVAQSIDACWLRRPPPTPSPSSPRASPTIFSARCISRPKRPSSSRPP